MPRKSEVKLLVPPRSWDALRDAADLGEPRERRVWFFDTPDRALLDAGVIVRGRVGGGGGELTVKVRGIDLSDDVIEVYVDAHGDAFKVEDDVAGGSITEALSLKVDDLPGEPPDQLSLAQLALIAHAGVTVPWDRIAPLGPVSAETWKVPKHDLTVERWTIGDEALVEVSRRGTAPPDELVDALAGLLAEWDVDVRGLPGGKTRWALGRL